MSVRERSTIDPAKLADSFKPTDRMAMAAAVCEALGECAERPLLEFEAAIELAAGCVKHHFGLDPVEYGVPLVTQAVAGLQILDVLTEDLDLPDAEKWIRYNQAQYLAWMKAKGSTLSVEDQKRLFDFVADQAIAVIRGEFDTAARQ